MADTNTKKSYVSLDNLKLYDEKIKGVITEADQAVLDNVAEQFDGVYDYIGEIDTQLVDDGIGTVIAYIDHKTEGIATEGTVDELKGKVNTLIGDDANKSVRTIAAEELAAQLVAEGAQESLDTLTEIAAWIQSHPDDAAAMNKNIEDLEKYVGTLPENADATNVVDYINEVLGAASEYVDVELGKKVDKVDGKGLSTNDFTDILMQNLDDAYAHSTSAHAPTNAERNTIVNIKVNGAVLTPDSNRGVDITVPTDYLVASDIANKADKATTLAGYGITDAYTKTELDEAFTGYNSQLLAAMQNYDTVVLAEAQKGIDAVQGNLDTHTNNTSIHVSADDRTKWNSALHDTDFATGDTNGTIYAGDREIAVKGLGSAAYQATTAFDASGSANAALNEAKDYTDAEIAKFEECSEAEINALFA